MALVKGICKNFGECDLADSKETQEVDKTNFVCEECGKPLHPLDDVKASKGKSANKKLTTGIVAVAAILLAAAGAFLMWGGQETTPEPEPVTAVPVENESLQNEQTPEPAELVQEPEEKTPDEAAASAPVSAQPNTSAASAGTKDFGYAVFKGTLKNGNPHDVNGRLIFNTSYLIDSRDPKKRTAEAGDYVIGEFSEGHLVQGIWYDANNQVKGSIIIGQ